MEAWFFFVEEGKGKRTNKGGKIQASWDVSLVGVYIYIYYLRRVDNRGVPMIRFQLYLFVARGPTRRYRLWSLGQMPRKSCNYICGETHSPVMVVGL